MPDIICCYKGRFLGMECKLPGGVLTDLQKRAIDKINKAGGIARRVESVADAMDIIRQADEEREQMTTTAPEIPVTLSVMGRALNSFQRAELALQYEPVLADKARERQRKGAKLMPGVDSAPGEVNTQLGAIASVSRNTIQRVKVLLENADEGTKKQLREGSVSVNRAYTELMERKKNEEGKSNG